jgi:hypothetical protein
MSRVKDEDTGQATVELALCLPVLVLMLAALVQVGVLVGDQVRVWHAAREAARVAAVDGDQKHILEAAESGGLEPLDLDVSPEQRARAAGDAVTVRLRFDSSRRIPLVGRLLGPASLSAEATMRIEQP